ncbi:3095_t:CDS:2, partial [Rhizophagus irregularis]
MGPNTTIESSSNLGACDMDRNHDWLNDGKQHYDDSDLADANNFLQQATGDERDEGNENRCCHYQKLLCQNRIEKSQPLTISKAWNNVSKNTIIHSWQKTGSEINDGAFEKLEQLIRQIPRNNDGEILNANIEEIVAAVCYEPDDNNNNEIESEIEIKTIEALES